MAFSTYIWFGSNDAALSDRERDFPGRRALAQDPTVAILVSDINDPFKVRIAGQF